MSRSLLAHKEINKGNWRFSFAMRHWSGMKRQGSALERWKTRGTCELGDKIRMDSCMGLGG